MFNWTHNSFPPVEKRSVCATLPLPAAKVAKPLSIRAQFANAHWSRDHAQILSLVTGGNMRASGTTAIGTRFCADV
jgi:hypothetical protein